MSIYTGELTKNGFIEAAKLLQASFPKMTSNSIELLKDRFKANGFNDARMLAAINHVIDNYEGWDKVPNIANFITYDKRIKIYSYNEILEQGTQFFKLIGDGKWIKLEDIEAYKIYQNMESEK